MFSDYQALTIDLRDDDRVVVCTIDTGGRGLNEITRSLHEELEQFFREASLADEPRVYVLTGGSRAFSAGGDIEEMRNGKLLGGSVPGGLLTGGGRRIIRNLLDIRQPVIAAVNGDAIGLGASVALLCDIVLMSTTARIGDPHTKVGLVAGDGGALAWPALLGPNRAKELLMTGRLLNAQEALDLRLINHLCEPDDLIARAEELAHELAWGARAAIEGTKHAVNRGVFGASMQTLDLSLALEYVSATHDDHREAVDAFLERRPASFSR